MAVEQLIVTDWPAGKGFDPSATGYQIKACSDGLSTEERARLLRISEHYGQAVYYNAPSEARARENAWDRSRSGREPLPPSVASEFPVIWSYDQLPGDRFALTRVCYIGWSNDGRLGNFFAHSLAFPDDLLETQNSNSLTLSRSALFRSADAGPDTSLPAFESFASASATPPDYRVLLNGRYRERLSAMISALSIASPSSRPMIIVVSDWREAAALVEALLNLLPPSTRRRTTVCTFETDRNWLPPTSSGNRPSDMNAAHHLLVIYGGDSRDVSLRKDEYQTKFFIFNFVANEFSEVAASPYAKFAAACVQEGKMNRLEKHHWLVESLGITSSTQSWDVLLLANALTVGKPSVAELLPAAQALTALSKTPTQAQFALDRLQPHLEAVDHETVAVLASEISILIKRGASGDQIRDVASRKLQAGQARAADAFLKMFGADRDQVCWSLFAAAPQSSVVLLPPETDRMLDLIRAALSFGLKGPLEIPPRLILACFRAAAAAGRTEELWDTSADMLRPYLEGEWTKPAEEFVKELETVLTSTVCPGANAALNLRLIETSKPQQVQLLTSIGKIITSAAKTTTPDKVVGEALRIAEKQVGTPALYAEFLAQLAEAGGDPGSEQRLYEEYRAALTAIGGKAMAVRAKLVDCSVVRLVCREVVEEILPRQEKEWHRSWGTLLKSRPKLADAVRSKLAMRIVDSLGTEELLPFLESLLPDLLDKPGTEPGALALYHQLALKLPLKPLSDRWSVLIPHIPVGLGREEKRRIAILRHLGEIQQAADRQNWSLGEFPHAQPVWQSASELSSADKDALLNFCVEIAASAGLTSARDAHAFVEILAPTNGRAPERIALTIDQLLKGRDMVTRVLAGVAFTDCALENTKQNWGAVAKAVLERFDREARKLVKEHLEHRFGRHDDRYNARLEQLYGVLEWALPKQAIGTATVTSGADDPRSGLLDTARGFWKRLRSPVEESKPAGDKTREK